ncbi:MAG: GreA/GreB family elongation factor [Candidatus Sungbacteria bacterium]|uniref:Transcription elongation factor GreA n=1 Tax=Candidatus Sungiibacteriota bacterium TaxID=2750080 RepID=A0A932YWV6_9BACT|nr:GreA/GreB family elongation factor [Candidatus Sungbacteria bacterium]
MRVPIRKSEKYTHLPVDPYMTREKFDELTQKLARMKQSRPALTKEVARLAENGDFSENAEYQIAKGKLRGLNQRMLETEAHLNRAIIIPVGSTGGIVQMGSTVTIESSGQQKTFRILGSSETKPESGIISHQSPIGVALIGKRVGDEAILKTKKSETKYHVVRIA